MIKEGLLTGLAHVGVDAVDTKKCAQFFVEKLGFEQLFSEPFGDGTIEFVGYERCILEIVPATESNKPHGQVNHFAIEVSNLEETMEYLSSIGIVFEGEPLVIPGFCGRGIKAAFFEGPEGMRIEICQYMS